MPFLMTPKTFVPPEAHLMAAGLHARAESLRELACRLATERHDLEAGWQGRSSQRFMDACDHALGEVNALVGSLEFEARRVQSVWVTVWESVWQPDGPATGGGWR